LAKPSSVEGSARSRLGIFVDEREAARSATKRKSAGSCSPPGSPSAWSAGVGSWFGSKREAARSPIAHLRGGVDAAIQAELQRDWLVRARSWNSRIDAGD